MLVSVALCTFNGSQYLKEQILSILNQDSPVNEIVISDDGSTDGTLSIIGELQEINKGVKWIVLQNKSSLGVTKNFEQALSFCTGDIILLSDQDDIWLPQKTKRIVDYFEQNPQVNLVFTDAFLVDANGALKTNRTLFDACGLRQLMDVWESGLQFEIENVIQRLLGATFGLRKGFVQQCLPFSDRVTNYHDGQLAMFSVVNDCNGLIDECLIKYRIHGNNVVGLGGENNWVYQSNRTPDEFAKLVEPNPINNFFLLPCADRIRSRIVFYQERLSFYNSITGKFRLIIRVYQYMRYYKHYWWRFFWGDVLYGVMNDLRRRIVSSYRSYDEDKNSVCFGK